MLEYVSYIFEFSRVNRNLDYEKRIFAEGHIEVMSKELWEYEEDGEWKPFTPEAIKAVAKAQLEHRTRASSRFFNPRSKTHANYDYDLLNLVQTNTATTFERKIRRSNAVAPNVGSSHSPAAASQEDTQFQAAINASRRAGGRAEQRWGRGGGKGINGNGG